MPADGHETTLAQDAYLIEAFIDRVAEAQARLDELNDAHSLPWAVARNQLGSQVETLFRKMKQYPEATKVVANSPWVGR